MTEPASTAGENACGHCGTKFRPKRRWQRFCSRACRFADWNDRNPRQRAVTEQLQRIEAKIDALSSETVLKKEAECR
jgi:hypothetical protein